MSWFSICTQNLQALILTCETRSISRLCQLLSVFENDSWLLLCSRLKYLWADVRGPSRMNPGDSLVVLTFPFVSMMQKVFSGMFETWRVCPEMQETCS